MNIKVKSIALILNQLLQDTLQIAIYFGFGTLRHRADDCYWCAGGVDQGLLQHECRYILYFKMLHPSGLNEELDMIHDWFSFLQHLYVYIYNSVWVWQCVNAIELFWYAGVPIMTRLAGNRLHVYSAKPMFDFFFFKFSQAWMFCFVIKASLV